MKKILLLIFTIIVITIGWGCSDCLDDAVSLDYLEQPVSSNTPHFVTLQDVQNLTKALSSSTRRASSSMAPEIICYEDAEHDTLLYICDKVGGGWTIYSSDTRVPPIVAQSDSCSFAHASENEALMAWVATIAEDMKVIKHASDAELNFTPSEIKSNKNYWKLINNPDEFFKEIVNDSNDTKDQRSHRANPFFYNYGHYEFCSYEEYTETLNCVNRLTQTDWHQNSLYNFYCPFKWHPPFTVGPQAPAGCVAIAGAQMLYFLHNKLGVPTTAPSQAYCNSTIQDYPDYNWDQTNYTTTIWDSMYISLYAAPLVANVGKLLGTEYGNNNSSANTYFLIADVFYPYGISCDYSNYIDNIDTIDSCLVRDNMPVILRAAVSGSNTDGHTFIVDRYLNKRDVAKTTYMWVYDSIPHNPDGSEMIVPILLDQVYYTYTPYKMIGMNWGWGPTHNDPNEWFNRTGNWLKNGVLYTDNRFMIHHFIINPQ